MEYFDGKLSEENYKEEQKRIEAEHKAFRQRVIDVGQKMIDFVKTNNIKLEHSVIVEDYYFLKRDENRDFCPQMDYLVFGPKKLGYSIKPETDKILNGMFIGDCIGAVKQMEEFMSNFNKQN